MLFASPPPASRSVAQRLPMGYRTSGPRSLVLVAGVAPVHIWCCTRSELERSGARRFNAVHGLSSTWRDVAVFVPVLMRAVFLEALRNVDRQKHCLTCDRYRPVHLIWHRTQHWRASDAADRIYDGRLHAVLRDAGFGRALRRISHSRLFLCVLDPISRSSMGFRNGLEVSCPVLCRCTSS